MFLINVTHLFVINFIKPFVYGIYNCIFSQYDQCNFFVLSNLISIFLCFLAMSMGVRCPWAKMNESIISQELWGDKKMKKLSAFFAVWKAVCREHTPVYEMISNQIKSSSALVLRILEYISSAKSKSKSKSNQIKSNQIRNSHEVYCCCCNYLVRSHCILLLLHHQLCQGKWIEVTSTRKNAQR